MKKTLILVHIFAILGLLASGSSFVGCMEKDNDEETYTLEILEPGRDSTDIKNASAFQVPVRITGSLGTCKGYVSSVKNYNPDSVALDEPFDITFFSDDLNNGNIKKSLKAVFAGETLEERHFSARLYGTWLNLHEMLQCEYYFQPLDFEKTDNEVTFRIGLPTRESPFDSTGEAGLRYWISDVIYQMHNQFENRGKWFESARSWEHDKGMERQIVKIPLARLQASKDVNGKLIYNVGDTPSGYRVVNFGSEEDYKLRLGELNKVNESIAKAMGTSKKGTDIQSKFEQWPREGSFLERIKAYSLICSELKKLKLYEERRRGQDQFLPMEKEEDEVYELSIPKLGPKTDMKKFDGNLVKAKIKKSPWKEKKEVWFDFKNVTQTDSKMQLRTGHFCDENERCQRFAFKPNQNIDSILKQCVDLSGELQSGNILEAKFIEHNSDNCTVGIYAQKEADRSDQTFFFKFKRDELKGLNSENSRIIVEKPLNGEFCIVNIPQYTEVITKNSKTSEEVTVLPPDSSFVDHQNPEVITKNSEKPADSLAEQPVPCGSKTFTFPRFNTFLTIVALFLIGGAVCKNPQLIEHAKGAIKS